MASIRKSILPALTAGLVLAGSQAQALDGPTATNDTISPNGTCTLRIFNDGAGNAFVSLIPGGPVQTSGGAFFDAGAPDTSNGPITAGGLDGCGWESATSIVQDGADGTYAGDDHHGITFRADDAHFFDQSGRRI